MKQFTMEQFTNKTDSRFKGTLATDRSGKLFDSRFRQTLGAAPRPMSEREMRAIEALTALRISARLSRHMMDRWAEKHGLSEGRAHVLFRLAGSPGNRLALGVLAEQLEVSPRNITGLIDHLERDGLVERIDDPDDRRSTYARLTAAGKKRLESMKGEGLDWQMKSAAGLSVDELENLRHACLKLIRNMTGAPVTTEKTA